MTQEKRDTISASNVSSHQLTPSEIELILEHTDKGYQMSVILNFKEKKADGTPRRISQMFDLGSWQDEAIGAYNNYKTRVTTRQYKLHYFDDGSLEVELK